MRIRLLLFIALTGLFLPVAPARADEAVLVGAGDIADCASDGDSATAALLDAIPGTIFAAGDLVQQGRADQYEECWDETWGRHAGRIRPAAGNREYLTDGGAPYFAHFGPAAGDPGRGWYSYDLGSWHVVVLNSNCPEIEGGCREGSPQHEWLEADLAASPARCTAAYWHHPFLVKDSGTDSDLRPLWEALHAGGVEVAMSGHHHTYQRYAPLGPDGDADADTGIRQFIVGTGGHHHRSRPAVGGVLEAADSESWGVLKLTLGPDAYSWEFVPADGATFTDSGTGTCH